MGLSDPQCAVRCSSQLQPHRGHVADWSMIWGFRFHAVGLQSLVPFPGISSDSSCHIYSKLSPCVPDSKLPRRSCSPIFSLTGKLFVSRPVLPEFHCYHPLDQGYKLSEVSGPHTITKTEKRVKWAQSPPGPARNWQNPPLHLHEASPPGRGGSHSALPSPCGCWNELRFTKTWSGSGGSWSQKTTL